MPSAKEIERFEAIGIRPFGRAPLRTDPEIAERRISLAEQKEDRMAGLAERQQRLQELRFAKSIVEAEQGAQLEENILRDSMMAHKKLGTLKADDPEFDTKYTDILATHRYAVRDPAFKAQMEINELSRKDALEIQARKRAADEVRVNRVMSEIGAKAAGAQVTGFRTSAKGELLPSYDMPKQRTLDDASKEFRTEFGVDMADVMTKPPVLKKNEQGMDYVEAVGKDGPVGIPLDRFTKYKVERDALTGGVPTIAKREEFDALPSGAIYINSAGKRARKP